MRTLLTTTCILAALAAPASAQRALAPLHSPGPFAAPIVEYTIGGDVQVIALTGPNYGSTAKPNQDLILYHKPSGTAYLVVNQGVWPYGQAALSPLVWTQQYECLVALQWPAGLTLTTAKVDEDAYDDVVGHHPDGRIIRWLRRQFGTGPGC